MTFPWRCHTDIELLEEFNKLKIKLKTLHIPTGDSLIPTGDSLIPTGDSLIPTGALPIPYNRTGMKWKL